MVFIDGRKYDPAPEVPTPPGGAAGAAGRRPGDANDSSIDEVAK